MCVCPVLLQALLLQLRTKIMAVCVVLQKLTVSFIWSPSGLLGVLKEKWDWTFGQAYQNRLTQTHISKRRNHLLMYSFFFASRTSELLRTATHDDSQRTQHGDNNYQDLAAPAHRSVMLTVTMGLHCCFWCTLPFC